MRGYIKFSVNLEKQVTVIKASRVAANAKTTNDKKIRVAAYCRVSIYFISFESLMTQLKKALMENRLESRLKFFAKYKLLIIDELGYQKMDIDSANLFFNLIAKRYEKLSTIITTNSPFSKWADIFHEPVLTNALLDRLLHHCSVININGPSYRLKDQMQYMQEDN